MLQLKSAQRRGGSGKLAQTGRTQMLEILQPGAVFLQGDLENCIATFTPFSFHPFISFQRFRFDYLFMRPSICHSCFRSSRRGQIRSLRISRFNKSKAKEVIPRSSAVKLLPESPPPASSTPPIVSEPQASPLPNIRKSPTLLTYYTHTKPPTAHQLTVASNFFTNGNPRVLFTTPHFRATPMDSSAPEVVFLGRSNVGKSSLLNAVFGVDGLARTSSKPGKTRLMCGFIVENRSMGKREDEKGIKGELVVLDMPGYGHGSRESWGQEIIKYLVGRKQLRRAFVLIDSVHGRKQSDWFLLNLLRENAIPHQILLSKVDRLIPLDPEKDSLEKIGRLDANFQRYAANMLSVVRSGHREGPGPLEDVIGVACEGKGGLLGIDNVRWAILRACGLDHGFLGGASSGKKAGSSFAVPGAGGGTTVVGQQAGVS